MKIEFNMALTDVVRLMDGLLGVCDGKYASDKQADLMAFLANRLSVQLSEAAVALDEVEIKNKAKVEATSWASSPLHIIHWTLDTVELDAAEKALLFIGNKIEAIKHLRSRHKDMGLKQAKDKIDGYIAANEPKAPNGVPGLRGGDRW